VIFTKRHGSFEDVFQFPDVAWKVIGLQGSERIGHQPSFFLIGVIAQLGQYVFHQYSNVAGPLSGAGLTIQ